MRKLKLLATATAIFLTAAQSAYALDTATQNFISTASASGEFEIESSRLALERSKDPEVRKFAQQMIIDHSKASGELKQASRTDEERLLITGKVDPAHATKLNELKTITAKGFDEEYLNDQAQAHDDAVSLFSDYSANGKDTVLKDFATKTLPILQHHQQMAKDLAAKY